MVTRFHRHQLCSLPLLLVLALCPHQVLSTSPVDDAQPTPNVFGVQGCTGCSTGNAERYGSRDYTPSVAPSENPFSFLSATQFGRSPAPSPSPYPTSSLAYTPATSSTWESTGNANFLIAAFFLIAAGWLFVAFLYAVLVLVVIRLRRRGPMDINDEYFGRIYVFGSPEARYQCYLPLGWLLRRYVMALNDRSVVANRMSRAERRASLEILFQDTAALKEKHHRSLKKKSLPSSGQADEKEFERADSQNSVDSGSAQEEDEVIAIDRKDQLIDLEEQAIEGQSPDSDELVSNAEPVCSICLGEYESSEAVFDSPTCPHRFHRDCILDWLERRDNTECPCCRGDIIDEEEVWKTVTRLRRQRRNRSRREGFINRLRQFVPFAGRGRDNPDESMETESITEDDTESPFDEVLRHHPLPPPPPPSQMNPHLTIEVPPPPIRLSRSEDSMSTTALPSASVANSTPISSTEPSVSVVNPAQIPSTEPSPSVPSQEENHRSEAADLTPNTSILEHGDNPTQPQVVNPTSSLGEDQSSSSKDVHLNAEEHTSIAIDESLDADIPTTPTEQIATVNNVEQSSP